MQNFKNLNNFLLLNTFKYFSCLYIVLIAVYIYVNIALVILWTRKYSDNVNIALNTVNIVIM